MSHSLYREIGGRDAVEAVVADFYDRVLADEQLQPYFEGADVAELRAHQVQFLSAVTGGPVEYTGADMRDAHRHLEIDEADFDAVGGHLETALRRNGVDEAALDSIMTEVTSLKDPVLDR